MTRAALRLLACLALFSAAPACLAAAPEFDVTTFGALPDGTTLDTAAIQKAIDTCNAQGGGVVRIPEGRFLIGTLELKSNVMLHLDDKATLLGSTDIADYRNLDPFIDGSGNPMGYALIVAVDADRVGIEGGGTIDGQGPKLKAKENPYTKRPFLIRWVRCSNITVQDVHLTMPGAWTLNFFQAKTALVQNVTIRSRGTGLQNNDGINIDSSEDIQVRKCDVDSGDDALVIKSTSAAKASRNITASDCKLSTRTNAIKLGTESIGGFDHISISDCQITNTQMAGIALYAVDGGDLTQVTISDVTMDGVVVPIAIRLGARLKTFRDGDQARLAPGKLSDITIKNVTAKNIKLIGILINGVPGHPVENLTLDNIALELPGGGTAANAAVALPEKETAYPEYSMFGNTMPASALYARHVTGFALNNLLVKTLAPDARPESVRIDVQDVKKP